MKHVRLLQKAGIRIYFQDKKWQIYFKDFIPEMFCYSDTKENVMAQIEESSEMDVWFFDGECRDYCANLTFVT